MPLRWVILDSMPASQNQKRWYGRLFLCFRNINNGDWSHLLFGELIAISYFLKSPIVGCKYNMSSKRHTHATHDPVLPAVPFIQRSFQPCHYLWLYLFHKTVRQHKGVKFPPWRGSVKGTYVSATSCVDTAYNASNAKGGLRLKIEQLTHQSNFAGYGRVWHNVSTASLWGWDVVTSSYYWMSGAASYLQPLFYKVWTSPARCSQNVSNTENKKKIKAEGKVSAEKHIATHF